MSHLQFCLAPHDALVATASERVGDLLKVAQHRQIQLWFTQP